MKYLIFILSIIAQHCLSADCHYQEVTALQAQGGNVLIQVKTGDQTPWRHLGRYEDKNLISYQSIAQQAIATGQSVMLRFDGGEPCESTDYSTKPIAFRLYK